MYPGAYADQFPDRPAVIQAETGEVTTYKQLHEGAVRLSNVLRSAGFQPGDHIAICMENHPRYLEVIWGCHYAGLVYTACSSRLTKAELVYIINDCAAKGFITSKYKADQALEVAGDIPNATLRLMLSGTVDGYDSYEDTVANASTTPLENMIDGTDMLYSSGTTGMPKGISRAFPATPIGTAAALQHPLQKVSSNSETG
jgi:long-chain acyl-CoA synthetase